MRIHKHSKGVTPIQVPARSIMERSEVVIPGTRCGAEIVVIDYGILQFQNLKRILLRKEKHTRRISDLGFVLELLHFGFILLGHVIPESRS